MGVHVYCVARPDHPAPPDLRGVHDCPVQVFAAGAVALWASSHPQAPGPGLDTARAHNRVVQAGMTRTHTPVPVRFGQWFDDVDAATQRTLEQEPHWLGLLDRFAGHAEYGIRVTSEEGPAREMHTAKASTGTEYMGALARRAADAARLRQEAEQLVTLLADRGGSALVTGKVSEAPGGAVSIVHLLAWEDVTAYHTIVNDIRALTPQRLQLTGPWPPYSFVE